MNRKIFKRKLIQANVNQLANGGEIKPPVKLKYNKAEDVYEGPMLDEVVVPGGKKGFWAQSRDKFIEENKGSLGASLMAPLTYPLGVAQNAMMYGLTGKVQDPSTALGIENPYGAIATNMVADPLNFVGGAAGKLSKLGELGKLSELKKLASVENIRNVINPTRNFTEVNKFGEIANQGRALDVSSINDYLRSLRKEEGLFNTDKLRGIYHNRKRILTPQELSHLNKYGVGSVAEHVSEEFRPVLQRAMRDPSSMTPEDFITLERFRNINPEVLDHNRSTLSELSTPQSIPPPPPLDPNAPGLTGINIGPTEAHMSDLPAGKWDSLRIQRNNIQEAMNRGDYDVNRANKFYNRAIDDQIDRYNRHNPESPIEIPERLRNLYGRINIGQRPGTPVEPVRRVNMSGYTKEHLASMLDEEGRKAIEAMDDDVFEKTVLKPGNKLATHNTGYTTEGISPLSREAYAEQFNKGIPRLNEIIAKNNKSGIPYEVESILPNGQITFKSEHGKSFFNTGITPGTFTGEVQDVANTNYLKGIPGISMQNTTSGVFGRAPVRGTKAYESINDYLKEMNLGRVKAGFNSQSSSSRPLWEKAVQEGKAIGHYGSPGTVYGVYKALGGYIQQDSLSPTLNNYLNSNMNQYKNGGMLNRYDVGGTHEQNPNGGIPIGGESSVEQGEAAINLNEEGKAVERPTGKKYIFSDRQLWTPDDMVAAGLPKMRGAMTASAYMKKLDDKFKGREGSKDALNTMQEFYKRAQGLAESKRQQEAQLNAAMQANTQQAPEDLPTEVPPGMEEYADQPPQMFMGGNFSRSEAGNLTGGASGISSTMPNARVNFACGGMMKRYDVGGDWYSNNNPYFSNNPGQINGPQNQYLQNQSNTSNYGNAISAIPQLIDVGYDLKGKNLSGNMGKDILGVGAKGAIAGAQIGNAILPGIGGAIGAAGGAGLGAIFGSIGSGAAKSRIRQEGNQAAGYANSGMPNASAWQNAMGGYITSQPAKYADGGIHINPANRGKFNATKERTGKTTEELTHSSNPLTRKRAVFAQNASKWHHAYGGPLDGTIGDEELTANLAKAYQTRNPVNAQYGSDTNLEHNVQRTIGLNPGKWGSKSTEALKQWQRNNGLLDFGDPRGGNTLETMGLTPGGRQYAENVNIQTQPRTFATPQTGPLLPQNTAATPMTNDQMINTRWGQIGQGVNDLGKQVGKYGKQFGNYIGDNSANAMRLSPMLSNFMQRENITKPTGTTYARLNDAFNVPQVDEAAGMRYTNQMFNNQRRTLGQMGSSQAQQRANLLGLGVQQGDMGSKMAYEAQKQNQELKLQEQQYKTGINQYNANAQDRGQEAYRADIGNYDTQRSKFTGQIGTDLGEIGKEQLHMKQVAAMYGYDWNGKYMINRKTGQPATPEEIAKIQTAQKTTVETPGATATTQTIKAFGGYIKRKPSKY